VEKKERKKERKKARPCRNANTQKRRSRGKNLEGKKRDIALE
jgi:hypothetical protein